MMAASRVIRWNTVYLDYCPEPNDIADELARGVGAVAGLDPDLDSCNGCPIGGSLECPGVWRFAADNSLVTQDDREAN